MNRRRIITTIIVLVVIALMFWLWKFVTAPAQGTIQSTAPKATVQKGDSYLKYSGKFCSFEYSSQYAARKSEDTGPGYFEAEQFLSAKHTNSQMAFAVKGGNFANDPNISQRQNNTLYKEQKITIDGVPGLEFSKTQGGYERTVYFERSGKLVSLSLTDPDNGLHDSEFALILGSWRWK